MGGDICLARQQQTTLPSTSATDTARGDKLRGRDLGRRCSATGLYSFSRPNLACRADKKVDLISDWPRIVVLPGPLLIQRGTSTRRVGFHTECKLVAIGIDDIKVPRTIIELGRQKAA